MYSNKLGLRETREEYRNGVFCKLLSEPFGKMYMTQGQGQWPRITRKKWVQKSCVSFEEECSDKVTTDCDDHQLGRLEIHEKIENWK